jgi:hypothetical protein
LPAHGIFTIRFRTSIGPSVPHDHPAGAIISFGNGPFKIQIVPRMVCDSDGEPLLVWIE